MLRRLGLPLFFRRGQGILQIVVPKRGVVGCQLRRRYGFLCGGQAALRYVVLLFQRRQFTKIRDRAAVKPGLNPLYLLLQGCALSFEFAVLKTGFKNP